MHVESVRYKLSKLVNENQLQTFYSQQAVQEMARQVAQKNLTGMARQWQLPSQVGFLFLLSTKQHSHVLSFYAFTLNLGYIPAPWILDLSPP